MKKEIMEKWVAALRSGEYKQGIGLLHDRTQNTYCCLGVLSELAVKEGVCPKSKVDSTALSEMATSATSNRAAFGLSYETTYLCKEVMDWSGVVTVTGSSIPGLWGISLVKLNDELSKSFLEIADIIEEHWEKL